MKNLIERALIFLLFAIGQWGSLAAEPLPLRATINLPGVSGRIDHMAFDQKGDRLFVAALGNNTVEVIQAKTGKRTRPITGLNSPQSILYIEELKCVVISNAGDGTVQFFNSESLKRDRTLNLGDDADNMRYDSAAKQIFVGYGNGALAVIDAVKGELLARIPLPGHPEAFELEPKGNRIFVNVPSAGQVAVVDRGKKVQIATWQIKHNYGNFAMALDKNHYRLFIGLRSPGQILVLDYRTGSEIASLNCVDDADDIFFDSVKSRIFVSGGAGSIDAFGQTDAGRYMYLSRTSTALGARTSIISPDNKTLYVAMPRLLLRPAQIRVYGLQ